MRSGVGTESSFITPFFLAHLRAGVQYACPTFPGHSSFGRSATRKFKLGAKSPHPLPNRCLPPPRRQVKHDAGVYNKTMIDNMPSPAGVITGPPPATAGAARFRLLAVFSGLLLLALAALAILVAAGLYLYSGPAILPGVQVMGVAVGGLEVDAAAQAVAAAWNLQTITIDTGAEPVTFQAADLGFTLDIEETINTAYALGRRPDNAAQAWQALSGGLAVAPHWHFDPVPAESRLQALADQLDTPAGNAGILIQNGRAEAVPPTPGFVVDVPATLAEIEARPEEVLATGRLSLVVQPTQPAFSDPAPLVGQLNEHLAHSLTIRAFDPIRNETFTWTAPPERWGEWIHISTLETDPAAIQWQLDTQQVHAFVESATAEIGPARSIDLSSTTAALIASIPAGSYETDVRLYHQAGEHTVQPGETLSSIAFDSGIPYPWIQEANPQLNGTLNAGQQITIPSPDVLLPLPVVENKRIVVSLSEQQMWAYENGEVKWQWVVSTGIASSPTAPGVFQIQNHEENAYAGNWDLWMPHFMGIYRPVPSIGFMNGFHGFPTRNGSNLLWTGDLGRPVTYGCILLSSENAQTLYEWAEAGVVVEVTS